ncbi:MBL fold metallo-hydrolase [Agromyces aerolatus]|uniref:MBL fold metallo-hydrolase n=1 Tax=Agromyces sp. LY-1074 TaxID=3074080 RepID=UPI0028642FFE|nr:MULTISPECIES: MBL fold metallo-hydrolase [unclassified Agromyces]MDR5699696.1 MBL fold metallo-hydrolase [Agromyces sp. LY-1074]MDR5705992.1 MBL fold metallo-hydrolase [Agromyces sp. LY-1358]
MGANADDPRPITPVSELASLVLAPNPGPMTLDGTNSYVLRAPGAAGAVVVDPGPAIDGHLRLLAEAGPVELILLTHHHLDHTAGAAEFASMTDAPVRAIDPELCLGGGAPLADGERIEAAGLELEVIATPGHTADSMCVLLPGDGVHGAVLTGDTVLGRGSTIIVDPDGSLGPYLDSLERLRTLASPGPVTVLPGHGPVLPDLAAICGAYLAHRAERLDQVRAALAELGAEASAEEVTSLVYHDVDPALRRAAEASVRAQLTYLRDRA